MKERHDLNIQQPFPDSEEGTPTKEKVEVKKEETLAQKIGAVKRKKSIATKTKAKIQRTEEGEKEQSSERLEVKSSRPIVAPSVEQQKQAEQVETQEKGQEQTSQQPSEQSRPYDEQCDLYKTVTDEEPVKVDPISVEAPEIIHWDTLVDKRTEYIRIKRMGEKYEVYSTWGKIIRSCSRTDLEEMYKVGLNLYGDLLKGA
ncbi:hypothetical protein L6452_42127 [Arctium lappa]|uniref:Uncharacterized protein n=1 Tax=Arctium lappa TaxID=4217 RepID=A0ACB8XIK5_ARCLA|nr:hypothetical protein L6452_42127 [Arctium lappa]